MYSGKYRFRKIWSDKNLKSRVSEDPYPDNNENGSRHCSNLNGSTFTQSLLNAVKVVALQKVCFSDTQNPKSVF